MERKKKSNLIESKAGQTRPKEKKQRKRRKEKKKRKGQTQPPSSKLAQPNLKKKGKGQA